MNSCQHSVAKPQMSAVFIRPPLIDDRQSGLARSAKFERTSRDFYLYLQVEDYETFGNFQFHVYDHVYI